MCQSIAVWFQTNLKRPVIPASFGSKVPSNIRQRYLNLIIDECLKFCPTEEQAYKKVLYLPLFISVSVTFCTVPPSLCLCFCDILYCTSLSLSLFLSHSGLYLPLSVCLSVTFCTVSPSLCLSFRHILDCIFLSPSLFWSHSVLYLPLSISVSVTFCTVSPSLHLCFCDILYCISLSPSLFLSHSVLYLHLSFCFYISISPSVSVTFCLSLCVSLSVSEGCLGKTLTLLISLKKDGVSK